LLFLEEPPAFFVAWRTDRRKRPPSSGAREKEEEAVALAAEAARGRDRLPEEAAAEVRPSALPPEMRYVLYERVAATNEWAGIRAADAASEVERTAERMATRFNLQPRAHTHAQLEQASSSNSIRACLRRSRGHPLPAQHKHHGQDGNGMLDTPTPPHQTQSTFSSERCTAAAGAQQAEQAVQRNRGSAYFFAAFVTLRAIFNQPQQMGCLKSRMSTRRTFGNMFVLC
jgi:hypothetical protein